MQELPIAYDPSVLRARVGAQRGRVIRGSISTGVTVIALVGLLLYVYLGRDGQMGEMLGMLSWLLGFSAVIGVVVLVGQIVWLSRLRKGLAGVGSGLAMIVSGSGIEYAGGRAEWTEVARLAAARGKPGHGYLLRIDRTDGSGMSFPLEGLDILPGTLDAATRAYSAGRHGVDLTVVDD